MNYKITSYFVRYRVNVLSTNVSKPAYHSISNYSHKFNVFKPYLTVQKQYLFDFWILFDESYTFKNTVLLLTIFTLRYFCYGSLQRTSLIVVICTINININTIIRDFFRKYSTTYMYNVHNILQLKRIDIVYNNNNKFDMHRKTFRGKGNNICCKIK